MTKIIEPVELVTRSNVTVRVEAHSDIEDLDLWVGVVVVETGDGSSKVTVAEIWCNAKDDATKKANKAAERVYDLLEGL